MNVIIDGNIVGELSGTFQHGIFIDNITGLTVSDNQTNTTTNGIAVGGGVTNYVISGNRMKGAGLADGGVGTKYVPVGGNINY